MTSIPASRRARAMTFAPRSCPSRPGFAMSTRIGRSFIARILSEGGRLRNFVRRWSRIRLNWCRMKRIGEILLGARAITKEVLDETLAYTKAHRVSFGTAILEVGAISEDALLRALSVQTGAPPVAARDLATVPPDVIRPVPQQLAEKHTALPFKKAGRTLYIAMA